MKRWRRSAVPAAIAALWLAFAAQAAPPLPDTSQWSCERCPFVRTQAARVRAGATWISDTAGRYGNATGYDEHGLYANLDSDVRRVLGTRQLDLRVRDLGVDARAVRLGLAEPGRFLALVTFEQYPYRLYDSTRTVFAQAGNARLVLPAGWQAAGTTAGFTGVGSFLQPRAIGSDRDVARVLLRFRPAAAWQASAGYTRQQVEGVQIAGGSYINTAALLPRVVDERQELLSMGLAFAGDRAALRLDLASDRYTNRVRGTTWTHPFLVAPGADTATLAGDPDSRVRRASLAGSLSLTGSTRLRWSAGLGRERQDVAFVPETTNEALREPLPRTSLDGEVDRRHLRLALTSRPSRSARVSLNYRDDRRDADTPRAAWESVLAESVRSGELRRNRTYASHRRSLGGQVDWRAHPRVRLTGGFDLRDAGYSDREIAEQTEVGSFGRIRWRASDALDLALRGGSSRREIDRFDLAVAVLDGQNPLLRKYDLAHRFRREAALALTYAPSDSRWQADAEAAWLDDDFSRSALGLLASDSLALSLGVHYTHARGSAYLQAYADRRDARQSGSEGFGAADWRARHDDRFDSVTLGARWRELWPGVAIDAAVSLGEGATGIALERAGTSGEAFPTVRSRRLAARLRADYRWRDNADIYVSLGYEDFRLRDWALDGIGVTTVANVLGLGARAWDYEVVALGIGMDWRFGAGDGK